MHWYHQRNCHRLRTGGKGLRRSGCEWLWLLLLLLLLNLSLTLLLSYPLALSLFSLLSFPLIVAAQEQGLPAGFTASCEQTCRENCVVRGNDGRGGDYKCWKKMPEKDTEDEESTSLGIAKTAYASVGVVLATVGSSVLLLCCSHM